MSKRKVCRFLPLLACLGCSAPHASDAPDNGAGGSSALAETSSRAQGASTTSSGNGGAATRAPAASTRSTSVGSGGAQSDASTTSRSGSRGGSGGVSSARSTATSSLTRGGGGTRVSSASTVDGAVGGTGSNGGGSDHGHTAVAGGSGGNSSSTSHAEQTQSHDHCVDGEHADLRDDQLTGDPDRWVSATGTVDLVLPKAVLAWMTERIWQPSHDAWHNVRRCESGAPLIGGGVNAICTHTELIPDHQECEDAEDGYQFLVMHRHMIQSLRQAFPQHAALFDGFPSFPTEASDVPAAWQDRFGTGWTQEVQDTAKLLESIENRLFAQICGREIVRLRVT